jgi:ABC-type multidrug transport system fused ATPase/permease subunit
LSSDTFTSIDLNDPSDQSCPAVDAPASMETLNTATEGMGVEKVLSSCMSSNVLRPPRIGIAWIDLWVSVSRPRNQSRFVLHGLTGYAEAGHILAVMGPSGSGKSTLLDELSGWLVCFCSFQM